MKIVVLDGYALNPGDLSWQGFEGLGDLVVYDRTPIECVDQRIAEADVVITNKTPLSREQLLKHSSIKYIGVLATGYNVVDIATAHAQDIVVTNVPTYGTDSVAQFVFALLLEVCHHVGVHNQSVHRGEWTQAEDFCYWQHPMMELAGKTIGIFGYGRIGRRVAEIAKAFHMNVLVHTRTPQADPSVSFVDAKILFERSDIISLHCPLVDATRGMINEHTLKMMKASAILINTARGPLVDQEAICQALDAHEIAYYAADVVDVEPMQADHIFLNQKRCLITPHIAWAPFEARQRLMQVAVKNLEAFLAGEPIHTV